MELAGGFGIDVVAVTGGFGFCFGRHDLLGFGGEAMNFVGAKVSAALTPEQQEILSKRGVLSPDEIHRLAAKTKKVMTAEDEAKASCHSDYVDPETARQLQEKRGDLVELTVP